MLVKQTKILKWGLYLNSLYILLLFLFSPDGINFQNILITSFLLFSAIAIFVVCIKKWNLIKGVSKNTRIVFCLLLFWGVITIVQSFSVSIQDWATNFGNIYMAYAWLTPLTFIVGLDIKYWKIVFKSIWFMFSLMFLAFMLLPFFNYNEEWILLLRPVNFVLIIGLYYFSNYKKVKVYLIVCLYLFAVIYLASRRIDQLFFVVVLLFLMMEKLLSISIKKWVIKYILIGFILVFTIIFTVGYEFVSNIFASLIEFHDTRTFLFQELFSDMNLTEKIFGRGSLGTYFSPFFEHTRRYWEWMGRVGWPGDVANRISIEVGYLQMILKGGFILLILNVLIYFKAIYVAIFKSNNWFIRRLGYFILIITILTLVELRPTFTPLFIIFWMSIGTVLKKEYRDMDDDEINNLIGIK